MLVLKRRKGESVHIDDRIKVTVVDVRGSSVKLAFEADAAIPIHRGEVFERLEGKSEGSDQACRPGWEAV